MPKDCYTKMLTHSLVMPGNCILKTDIDVYLLSELVQDLPS